MLEGIKCLFPIMSSIKQWRQDPNCLITSLRIELIQTDNCTQSKEAMSCFEEKPKKDTVTKIYSW